MAQGDGLRLLHVRVAGHDVGLVRFGRVQQRVQQLRQVRHRLVGDVLDVHAAVQGHLVVAAAAGVQALARLADARGQERLDVHVDVLGVELEVHLARLDVLEQVLQARDDRVRIRRGQDPLLAQHRRVGDGAFDVLLVEPLVERDGGVEVVHHAVGGLFKASAPEFHVKSPP